jgi:thioredoxin-like negative regulator of GroEL
VLVAFLAPSSQISPVLDEVALACAGRAKVVRINTGDFPDLDMWYEIQSVPTLLCLNHGEVCARIVGTASKEAILSKLEPFLPGV